MVEIITPPSLMAVGARDYLYEPHDDGRRVVGFGDAEYEVRFIPRTLAVETITRRHYSGRIVNNSYVHLGVFHRAAFVGCLQFGYAMNPASGGSVVEGTGNREYLELNRMWVSDAVGRNAESMAIGYAVRVIRAVHPQVQWIQSFADERCGRWGVVYQAANFLYCGFHRTAFWLLDGVWYHDLLRTAHLKGGLRGQHLRANLHRAERHLFRQFRYLLPLRRSVRRRLRYPVLPYPKPEAA